MGAFFSANNERIILSERTKQVDVVVKIQSREWNVEGSLVKNDTFDVSGDVDDIVSALQFAIKKLQVFSDK